MVTMFTPDIIDEDTILEQARHYNQTDFYNLLGFLSDYYHNEISLVSDATYDELVDLYESKYGPYTLVGAEPRGDKVALPYYLGSLRKLKTEAELATWMKSYPGPYILEDKVDGLTLLLVAQTEQNGRRSIKLYTRGRGVKGTDVSHLAEHIHLPPITQDIAIRGEIVMTKASFQKVGAGFKNARNLASGIVNSKESFNSALARELTFVAYRIMNADMTPEQHMGTLMVMGFTVPNPVATPDITFSMLDNYNKLRKNDAPYEIDGIVIYQNIVFEYPVGENPRHAIAFKTATEKTITTVIDVVWEASKDRLLKPVVWYEPVELSGATLQKASGYNARFIILNNIGPGAKIQITRSGDVIPRILTVLEASPNGPAWPDQNVHGTYDWNENQVEFVVTSDNDQVLVAKLEYFLSVLDIKNVGPARVQSLVQSGIRNIHDLLTVTYDELLKIPSLGSTLAAHIYNEVHTKTTNVPLHLLLAASGIFPNIGRRRFEAITDAYPNFIDMLRMDPNTVAYYIQQLKGFKSLAVDIASKLSTFADWLDQHPMITVYRPSNQPVVAQTTGGASLSGKTIVFSGFRDKELEAAIKARGGKVTTSISRNTSYLIMKDVNDKKGKAIEAEQKGVPLIARDDFVKQFL